MPFLYNKSYSPQDLQHHVATMDQLCGIRLFEYSDGRVRGMRAAEFWTGSGFRFTVHIDRGLDIGPAEYGGIPLAWIHPALATPTYYEPTGYGFTRTFGGGLLTTGGLTHFGQPDQEGNESLGLHGRISHIPGANIRVFTGWQDDQYLLQLEGEVLQAVIFGENLLLRRRITTWLGSDSLKIEDTVLNSGYRTVSHMILYHCNFGFPIVSENSMVKMDDLSIIPRDMAASEGLDDCKRFSPPTDGMVDQVFFHTLRPDREGFAQAAIHNPAIAIGTYVRFRTAELPALTQWKFNTIGDYVCALEPCSTHEAPRETLRKENRLKNLSPGEEVQYHLEIGVKKLTG